MVTLVASISAVVLAVVLALAAKIDALRGTPRSRWLSFSGGVAITYVFLKLLPELTSAQGTMEECDALPDWLRAHVLFLVSLAGATALFGIERAAKRTKEERGQRGSEERAATWVFCLHAPVMAVYVAFIAYLLFREEHVRAVAVLGAIMSLHFSGMAVALADDYRSLYSSWGRWILVLAVLAGGVVGYQRKLPELTHHLILAVLAGAVIFSVVKEEIPPEQQSRFWALALGVLVTVGLIWSAA